MNSTGSQWISSNLSLTGFTLSQAAFMTCKELIENALDATSSCSQPSVGLHIESGAECLEISCSDNGSGFGVDSIESLHTVFQSTPAVGGDVRTGKFGIGLKAIAMMSHSACRGRDVVITSVRAGSDACIQFSLGCGESNEVVIKEVTLAHSPDHSPGVTSRVTVFSPHPSDFDAFLTSVEGPEMHASGQRRGPGDIRFFGYSDSAVNPASRSVRICQVHDIPDDRS